MSVRNIIDAIVSGDSLAIQQSFETEMANRIVERLDVMKQSVAQNMFATESTELNLEDFSLEESLDNKWNARLKNEYGYGYERFNKGHPLTVIGQDKDHYIVKPFAVKHDGDQKIHKRNVEMLDKAVGKLTKESIEAMVSEDFEQLDELSKKTLASYIGKASKAYAKHDKQLGLADKANWGKISRDDRQKYDKNVRKVSGNKGSLDTNDYDTHDSYHLGKLVKREKGISKAVGKLTKEETEQLANEDLNLEDFSIEESTVHELAAKHGLVASKNGKSIKAFDYKDHIGDDFEAHGYDLHFNQRKGHFDVINKAEAKKKDDLIRSRKMSGFNASGTRRTSANVGGGRSVNGIKK